MSWEYRCNECGNTVNFEAYAYLCPACRTKGGPGKPLRGVLECCFDVDEAKMHPEAIPLPIEAQHFPTIPVGNTPLWNAPRLAAHLGLGALWLKDDCCEPSGSFKDRASILVAAMARRQGITKIALASTGNAASSMACIGANAGLDITVFVPKNAPQAKRTQVLQYGAHLVEVNGNYDLAFDLCTEYCQKERVLSRNTAFNPLTIEGKKTAAFEILADLLKDNPLAHIDHVFVPTGDGVILCGLYKGFADLVALGRLSAMPTLWAAQAEGSSAIARGLETGRIDALPSSTLADSIAVDAPRNGVMAIAKLRKHNGKAVVVSDNEILQAQILASSLSGLFCEPSSACALAGLIKSKNQIGHNETVVVMLTGTGLKDIPAAQKAVLAKLSGKASSRGF